MPDVVVGTPWAWPAAEIHQYDPTALFTHDVLRFHVSVNQSGAMHRGEGTADVAADGHRFTRAKHAVVQQPRLQRAAVHQLHPQARPSLPDVGAVNRDDVRMPHFRDRLGFSEEPCRRRIAGNAAPQELQGHVAVQLRVVREVELSETPDGEALD